MEEYVTLAIDYGVRVIGVIIIFFVATKFASWLHYRMVATLTRRRFDETLAKFLASVFRYAILLLTGLSCLGIFGVETTSFAALIGAAGLAIGLAFQGTLSNVASGVMLVALRPFNAGDVVSADDVTGTVVEIGLMTCELRDPAGLRVIVPNSAMFGATIRHLATDGVRRVDIPVGTDYGADIDATRAALEGALQHIDHGLLVDGRSHGPFLSGLGASSVDWELRLFCKPSDYWAVWEAGTRAVKVALDEAEIGIPYNTVDVNLIQSGQV
jgi:small conductance mechanosensitive channel